MSKRKDGEVGRDERIRQHLELLYARETCERQVFVEDLKEYRRRKHKILFGSIVTAVGPTWYQALSVQQRIALDSLARCIYQDLLEGRPVRTAAVIHKLGVVPLPSSLELMSCITSGSDDPKEMLAQLYFSMYGYPINGKRLSYCLNARLILSAILYLGLDNLILMLGQTFAPDRSISEPEPKPKPRPPPKLPSPYLTQLVAPLYVPDRPRRTPPLPLPDLTALNEPYEEEPVMMKPPPPPPPPPPPKKRIPVSHCEKLAGIETIRPYASPIELPQSRKSQRLIKKTRIDPNELNAKKKYGIGIGLPKKGARRKKLRPPSTGLWNAQYTINGVVEVQGKTCYILGNVTILPALGELIHGGYALSGGQIINIHCGFRGWPPEHKPDSCNCLKQWHDAAFKHVKNTKCNCGHRFDLRNEGSFSQEELPYFTKPTRHTPLQFHYDTIFDPDAERLYITKTFKKIWETESALRTAEDTVRMEKRKNKEKAEKEKELKASQAQGLNLQAKDDARKVNKKELKAPQAQGQGLNAQAKDEPRKVNKKEIKAPQAQGQDLNAQAKDEARKVNKPKKQQLHAATSQTCLGTQPKITDYLKCALRLMRKVNIAARLPDLYLVPELVEWMRHRLYGRLTVSQKKDYLRKSTTYWSMFKALADHSFGHVNPPKEPKYGSHTTWKHKQSLNDHFRLYTQKYKLCMFKSHAYVSNLFWRTMYQAEFPDKKFREIFFSYLFSRVDDMQLIHPYSSRESLERKTILMNNRYICLPPKFEQKT